MWTAIIRFAIDKANFLVVNTDWEEKAKAYTHYERLKLMERLWLQDYKNSIQYFNTAVTLSTKKQIKDYLEMASQHLELPVGNWLYCMINDVMYANPLYNPNL